MDEKLQKYVSDCGLMSRRAAEKEIELGNFEINGQKAGIGDRVNPKTDIIKYKGKVIKQIKRKIYICLNKPVGYVTTMSDELGRKSISELISDVGQRVYPAGRLDMDSEGLIICTNDGEFANMLMHPSGNVKKIYSVIIRGKIENSTIDALRSMKMLDDEKIAPVEVELIERSENSSRLKMVLSEGKNRQIRRMCEHYGLSVMQLKRIAIGGIFLGSLESGKWRNLTNQELQSLIKTKKVKKGGIS
jgi:23S rRNA pseudouridine2605 synthase